MNFFDFLMAMSRNNPGGMSYGRDPRSTRVSFPIQQAAQRDTGFMPPQVSLPWPTFGQYAPSATGPSGGSRNVAQQGLVGGQLPGLQFNGGGGNAAFTSAGGGGQRPMQAMPAPAMLPPQLVGGQLPGIQFQTPPAQGGSRNTSTASSRNGSGSSMYNNFVGQGYQPVSFGGG